MFSLAALFNLSAVLLLGIFQEQTMPILGMEPITNTAFLHLFLALVLVFGAGYYVAGRDIEKNRNIIWLGAGGKSLVVVLLTIHAVLGNISWELASVGLGDALFMLLFLRVLKRTPHSQNSGLTQGTVK